MSCVPEDRIVYVLYPFKSPLLKVGMSAEPLYRWKKLWGSRGRWCPERSVCWQCSDPKDLENAIKLELKRRGWHRPKGYCSEGGWTEWFSKRGYATISSIVAEMDPRARPYLPTVDHFLRFTKQSETRLPMAKRSAYFWGLERRYNNFTFFSERRRVAGKWTVFEESAYEEVLRQWVEERKAEL